MYKAGAKVRKPWLKRTLLAVGIVAALLVVAVVVTWRLYSQSLHPVSTHAAAQSVTVSNGMSPSRIASLLQDKQLIRNAWTFEIYVRHMGVAADLQAGTYSLSPTQSVQDIVAQLTHGKVTTELVTILPGQRLDQIQRSLINDGYSEIDVIAALQPGAYEDNAALADKPAGNSLEGYLYPDSFQRTDGTDVSTIVQQSIAQMQRRLTPDIRAAFTQNGLSTYEGIILASIVEQEVSHQSDRAQAAQVFLKRLDIGMLLGSDVTALYGSRLAGQGALLSYDTPYNTRLHAGLPPTPISNVSDSSLQAVAHPADTNWLFFVAGDDGTTHFSRTLAEHESLAQRYCHKLCR